MTDAPITASDFAWRPGLTPGRYPATVHKDSELWLFSQISKLILPHPWMIEILDSCFDLTEASLGDLRDPDGTITLRMNLRFNQLDQEFTLYLPIPSKVLGWITPVSSGEVTDGPPPSETPDR